MTIRGLVLSQPPAAVKQQQDFPNGSPRLLNLLASKDALPFRQQDWPLPTPVKVNPALWGFTESTRFRLIGKDALPAARQQDWPTPPKGREIHSALYGFTGSYLLGLIGLDRLPNRQQDWPLPKGREIHPALYGHTAAAPIWFPAPTVQSPFYQADWPNPVLAVRPLALLGFTGSYQLGLIGKDALPNRQQDWPLPKGKEIPPALYGFTDSFKLELIGQDALPFSQTDWPPGRVAPWLPPGYSVNLLPLSAPVAEPAAPPDFDVVLLPFTDPGAPPRLGGLSALGDRDFQALAYMASLDPYLNDVDQFISEVEENGDEYVDLAPSEFDDDDLSGKDTRQWRKPRRR